MKVDLTDSPWAIVLIVALACLVFMTLLLVVLASLQVKGAAGPLLAGMGVWSSLVVTALGIGTTRAKRGKNGTGDEPDE